MKKNTVLISLLLSSVSIFPHYQNSKIMELNNNKIKYQFFDEQGKSHTVDQSEYDGRANDYARLYPKDQMRMVDKHGQSGLVPSGKVEEAISQGYRPFTISCSVQKSNPKVPFNTTQSIFPTIENKAKIVMIIVGVLLVILFFRLWIKKRNRKRSINLFTRKEDCDSKTKNIMISSEKNQTKNLGEKLYNLYKLMRKAKPLNSIINKSIIAIIIIYLACALYLFALNGRYKPIGNSEYSLYVDSWTGKTHSSLVEFEKQNR